MGRARLVQLQETEYQTLSLEEEEPRFKEGSGPHEAGPDQQQNQAQHPGSISTQAFLYPQPLPITTVSKTV